MMGAEAQLGGAGARPPLAPERGGRAPPPPAEWKERKNGENQKKTNWVIVDILLYYS